MSLKTKSLLQSSLDGILASRTDAYYDGPGVQVVLVSTDKGVLYEGAAGLANPVADQNKLVTPYHSANLYSLSKFFTACCALKLIDNGKLSPTSLVKDFFDDDSDMRALLVDNNCTIEQLVAHEAGAPNPLPLSWVHSPDETVDEKEKLCCILKQHPFNKALSSPTKRSDTISDNYHYSNVGYWVLSHVVTKACHVPPSDFAKCCDDLLFSNVNVKGECLISDSFPADKPMAYGHVPRWSVLALVARFFCPPKIVGPNNASWLRMEPHCLDGVGYGGLIASSSSVSNFLLALLQGSILSPASFRRLFRQVNRKMTSGLHIRPHRGLATYHKEGGGAGCHSSLQIRPQEQLAGCVISGDAMFDVDALLNEMLDCVHDYEKETSRIEPQNKFVVTEDGTQLYTKLFTKETNMSDPPLLNNKDTILLIHGGPGVPDYLDDLAELILRNNIAVSVICFDQRGVGKSVLSGDRNTGITMDLLLDDIDAIKKTYDIQKLHIVGHSWGGVLAQLYAQRSPKSIASMVLLSPTTVSQGSDWQKMEMAVMNHNRRQGGLFNFAKMGLWSLLIHVPLISNYAGRALFTMVTKNYYFHPSSAPNPSVSFLDGVSVNAMLSSKQAFVGKVTQPISIQWDMFPSLCLFGENDIYGKEMTSKFCASFKGDMQIIPDASHMSWVDRPLDIAQVLRTFYGKGKIS
jgi:pimeloyl-ACP methyl ester carboxylesterase/CubicO group peptidase (beta-lactamase class C family)